MAGSDGSEGRYASPPCMAGEIAPGYIDPLGVAPEQARDVARWRRAERARLAGLREGLGQTTRTQASVSICDHLAPIPVPPRQAETLTPDTTLAPCLGWDDGYYRLGWGGGYCDRTFAALMPRPVTIGVALAAARLNTIFPQPHDIPLGMIVTETGLGAERKDPS